MVEGTVKIDDSEELKKLYQAARNARETSDFATAIKHYEKISAKDPNSWEAMPNSSKSPAWGRFMTIGMIIFCVFPGSGALIGGVST